MTTYLQAAVSISFCTMQYCSSITGVTRNSSELLEWCHDKNLHTIMGQSIVLNELLDQLGRILPHIRLMCDVFYYSQFKGYIIA